MREPIKGTVTFPGFRYYKLDRAVTEYKDGTFVPLKQAPRRCSMHMDILEAATRLLRHSDGCPKKPWADAMLYTWLNWIPPYFFNAPASATHKFHPRWADRPDGLLLHSLAVCRVAASLTDLVEIPDLEYNTLVFAAWHHDMFKYGELESYTDGEMTVHEHPMLAGDFFLLPEVRGAMAMFGIGAGACDRISDLISTHAGPYRCSRFSDLRLPECNGQLNRLLSKADYIASRKEDGWVSDLLAEIPDPD